MSVKDDLLNDFPEVYPGLTRPEAERLLTLLDQSAGSEGKVTLSIANAVKPLVPDVASRIENYKQKDVENYVRILRGGVVLLLQRWQADGEPPSPNSISTEVANLESDA